MTLSMEDIINGMGSEADSTRQQCKSGLIERKIFDNNTMTVNDSSLTSQEDDAVIKEEYKMEIVWPNVLVYVVFHCGALYGFYLSFTDAKWATILWGKLRNIKT